MDFLDINHRMLIALLSAGIRNECPVLSGIDDADWRIIETAAGRHEVTALLYNTILHCGDIQIPEDIMEKFRKQCLYEVVEQDRNYLAFGEILKKLSASGIPVIVLKGLFLRDLYPDPCLRSMCDYDILLRPDDFEKAGIIMEDAGYKKVFDRDKHDAYSHSLYKRVELHKSMVNADQYANLADFEERVWKNAVSAVVSGVEVLTLDPTDQTIYLVLHMASHIKSGGFGLRQLCDWVLFIEKYRSEINWSMFGEFIRPMGLEVFTHILFEACRRLFCLQAPQEWRSEDEISQDIAERFVLDILDSGVFGKDGNDRITANRILYYTGGVEAITLLQKMRALFILFFPKAEKMDIRFEYAKKFRILLPVAWLHRFAYIIVRRDISLLEKISVLRPKKAAEICTNRSLLLHQLGLLKK